MADSKAGAEPAKPGLVEHYGVSLPWMVTKEALDSLKAYDVWEDDVWVVTYPKAGTHWVVEIVNLILVNGHEDKINRAQQASPAEFVFNQPGRPLMNIHPLPPNYETMRQWKAPRVIMTHLREHLLPSQIYKVIYVIRNPKDTAVSNWHFVRKLNFDPRYRKWNDFVRVTFSENMMFGSWFDHVLDYWRNHRYDKNFLFLKYEDMHKDLKESVKQISHFLGKNLSEEAVDRVVELSSFNSMKNRFHLAKEAKEAVAQSIAPSGDRSSAPQATRLGQPPGRIGALRIIRKGIVGDWKVMFTVEQNEEVDALYRQKMARSGLTIQFELPCKEKGSPKSRL